jgi:hypothetical protein
MLLRMLLLLGRRHASYVRRTRRAEVMQFVGFEGRDLSVHLVPPNLGILSLRHPSRT